MILGAATSFPFEEMAIPISAEPDYSFFLSFWFLFL